MAEEDAELSVSGYRHESFPKLEINRLYGRIAIVKLLLFDDLIIYCIVALHPALFMWAISASWLRRGRC
jgi:hypothetical protein